MTKCCIHSCSCEDCSLHAFNDLALQVYLVVHYAFEDSYITGKTEVQIFSFTEGFHSDDFFLLGSWVRTTDLMAFHLLLPSDHYYC